ncbi:MAG: endopeptidase La [Polyangiales bacterium]
MSEPSNMNLRHGALAPSSPFPILPLRAGVLFPGSTLTLPVGRPRSVAMLATVHPGDVIGVVAQRDGKREEPTTGDLYAIGTFARIVELARVSDSEYRLVIQGLDRFRLEALVRSDPFWLAEGELVHDELRGDDSQDEARRLVQTIRARLDHVGARTGGAATQMLPSIADPGIFADQVAALLGGGTEREMQILGELDIVQRLHRVLAMLDETTAATEVKQKIDSDVRQQIGKGQREAILREQLRAIQKELGDDKQAEDVSALREKLEKAGLSDEAKQIVDRELRRLESIPSQMAEHGVIRNYLEWISDLPWSARAEAKDDLDAVAKKLNDDHAGLEDVKQRILEHMAVLSITRDKGEGGRGTILCLAGPPGVGKTSLGQSIADATGRPFVRVSLGGVSDEAELRGHRRTYVGSLPGRIVHALKKAKVKNPVMLLDEIDKLGTGWRGSPEAALLEILDPEQNKTFTDHYLELGFDLSEVLFVCTANDLASLSPPLRDRLEIIELSGYTSNEKQSIARTHLLPKQLKRHGLAVDGVTIDDAALARILRDYTREAGVRQLERELTKICRAAALEVARHKDSAPPRVTITEADVIKHLGKPRYFSDVAERTSIAGVATGLAWTAVGGDILFIETTKMPGKGSVEITGQLGDVMKESARAAMSFVRSHASELGIATNALEGLDVHIHVPAGGVPKDGPSAGVTMFTALTSLLSGRRVRHDTAMTGECSLRGRVLPVGGIKAKVMAAHRAGITRVLLPKLNARDLDDVPREVLTLALEPTATDAPAVPVTGTDPHPGVTAH